MASAAGRIGLIGGTREGIELAIALSQSQIPCTISVTTEVARSGYPLHPCLKVTVARFTASTLRSFLHSEQIVAILDASHPFAVEISQLAMTVAQQQKIPYLRYERPELATDNATDDDPMHDSANARLSTAHPRVLEVDSLVTLLQADELLNQRVLLTLGHKALAQFRPWQARSTLFARVLPSPVAVQAALDAGFGGDRILALRPPVPIELERALWQHWHISLVVTKASGQVGGEAIKRQVAASLGVRLVVIQRPPMVYPQQTSTIKTALTFCQTVLALGNRSRHVKTD